LRFQSLNRRLLLPSTPVLHLHLCRSDILRRAVSLAGDKTGRNKGGSVIRATSFYSTDPKPERISDWPRQPSTTRGWTAEPPETNPAIKRLEFRALSHLFLFPIRAWFINKLIKYAQATDNVKIIPRRTQWGSGRRSMAGTNEELESVYVYIYIYIKYTYISISSRAVLKLAPRGVNFAALTVERVRTKGLGG